MKLKNSINNLGNVFTGYYTSKVLQNGLLLLHRVDRIDESFVREAEILVYDVSSSEVIVIDKTRAVNWQQGSMLQWYDEHRFIFNDFQNGKIITKIYDIRTLEMKIVNYSFSSASNLSNKIICLNHHFLASHRPSYSYPQLKNSIEPDNMLGDLSIVDITKGVVLQTISTSDCRTFIDRELLSSDLDYIEHPEFNESGNQFYFYYRVRTDELGIITYVFIYDIEKRRMHLINDTGRITHSNWIKDNKVVSWGGGSYPVARNLRNNNSILYKSLKTVYKLLPLGNSISGNSKISSKLTGDSYCITTLDLPNVIKEKVAMELRRDGHPSILDNLLITDTYPDSDGEYFLHIYDLTENVLRSSISFKQDINFISTGKRCDLHPKVIDNLIIVDRLLNGKRFCEIYEI